MKNNKLILDYSRLPDAKLAIRSNDVINSLTGNPNFPTTLPSLADFTEIRTAFITHLDKTTTGDRYQIALKNQSKAVLISTMRQLAMDIDAQANGDKAKLLTSGFELATDSELPSVLGIPSDFKIMDGTNPGELKLTCKAASNATSYLFDISEEAHTEESKWQTQASSRRTYTFKNLRSGTKIYARIRAIGRKGQENSSDVLSRIVQ